MNLDYQDTKKRNESSHLLEHIKELKDKEMERRKQAMASQAAQSNDLQMEDDDMMIMMDDEMNNYEAEFSAQEEKPNLSEAVYEVTDQPINIPDKNADDSLWTFETHKEINRQLYALQYDNIMVWQDSLFWLTSSPTRRRPWTRSFLTSNKTCKRCSRRRRDTRRR